MQRLARSGIGQDVVALQTLERAERIDELPGQIVAIASTLWNQARNHGAGSRAWSQRILIRVDSYGIRRRCVMSSFAALGLGQVRFGENGDSGQGGSCCSQAEKRAARESGKIHGFNRNGRLHRRCGGKVWGRGSHQQSVSPWLNLAPLGM